VFRFLNTSPRWELTSHSLAAMPIEKVEQAAVQWKEEQPAWHVLRKLLSEP
jgi:hypothetical protein